MGGFNLTFYLICISSLLPVLQYLQSDFSATIHLLMSHRCSCGAS